MASIMVNAFIFAFILVAVWLACSKAECLSNDVSVFQRISTLERELFESRIEHAKAIEKLEKELFETRADLKSIKNIFSESASTTQGLNETSVYKMPNAVLARAARQTGTYAFTAYLDHTIQHLGIGQTILFNQVHLNLGNGYNRFTGTFTCPVDGTYVFSFFVSNYYRRQVVAELVMDGRRMLHAIADTATQTNDYFEVQGGNLAVLHCPKGSGVWVTNVVSTDALVSAADDERLTSFSGFLLS